MADRHYDSSGAQPLSRTLPGPILPPPDGSRRERRRTGGQEPSSVPTLLIKGDQAKADRPALWCRLHGIPSLDIGLPSRDLLTGHQAAEIGGIVRAEFHLRIPGQPTLGDKAEAPFGIPNRNRSSNTRRAIKLSDKKFCRCGQFLSTPVCRWGRRSPR